jgi:hypothetical protein
MRLTVLFKSHEILEIVDGTTPRLVAAGADQKKWDKGNIDALAVMLLSMSNSEVEAVSSYTTATQIWTKLASMYQSISGESKQAAILQCDGHFLQYSDQDDGRDPEPRCPTEKHVSDHR